MVLNRAWSLDLPTMQEDDDDDGADDDSQKGEPSSSVRPGGLNFQSVLR